MRVLLNDPVRQLREGSDGFVDLEYLKNEADVITFHTPLTKDGAFKTFHLADRNFFHSLSKKPVIINTARGGVIDTEAIKEAIADRRISGTIIDCWENEPCIDKAYMRMADIATPHIAGYSADGKANASRISLENLAEFWNLPKEAVRNIRVPDAKYPFIDLKKLNDSPYNAILHTCNPLSDSGLLNSQPERFSALRSQYPLRREYAAYTVLNAGNDAGKLLAELGFGVILSV
jgi:erythronate-4-phosphate dehydrogenase